jgi:hypothetical protein
VSSPLSSEDAEFDVSMLEPPPFPGMYLMLEQSRPAPFFFLLRMRAYPCLWFGEFLVSRALHQIYDIHERGDMTVLFTEVKGGGRLRLTPFAKRGIPEDRRIEVHLCNVTSLRKLSREMSVVDN